MSTPRRNARAGPWALTGTPGTGKSTVARLLPDRLRAIEVGDLARALGTARGSGRSTEVDIAALARALRRPRPELRYDVLVGHLAHLLPVRGAIVLRCQPLELDRRLRRARRGTAASRFENVVCEATDLVLGEARDARLDVVEIDTTRRSPAGIAREVVGLLDGRRARRGATVDWLADPTVTEYLLERAA